MTETRGKKKQEWLISDYSLIERAKEGYTVSEMSKMYHVNYSTIYNRIVKLGIDVNKKTKKYKIDKNWLMSQLKIKKQKVIAQELGTNYETLRRLLKRMDLYDYARKLSKQRKRSKRYEIEKQTFIDLINEDKTPKQIQKILKLDDEMFGKYVIRYQLKRVLKENELKLHGTDLIKKIKTLWESGKSAQKIAEKFGMKHYQVGYLIRKYIKNMDEGSLR